MDHPSRKSLGKIAEEKAAEYLQQIGYEVITRNFSIRYGEIDLICRDNDTVVFVEVKGKTSRICGRPEEMFTRYKYEQVKRMAQVYLGGKEVKSRIDMVAVEIDPGGGKSSIRHYKNVYLS